MAKLTLRAESSYLFSHHARTLSQPSLGRRRLLRFPPKHNLEFRVFCSIKEKESVKESKRVNGLPGDKVHRAGSASDSEGESGHDSGSGELGLDLDWSPWKNIPQRYKLIGTTSLAFVICNMDKVLILLASLTLLLTSSSLEFEAIDFGLWVFYVCIFRSSKLPILPCNSNSIIIFI